MPSQSAIRQPCSDGPAAVVRPYVWIAVSGYVAGFLGYLFWALLTA